MIGGVMGPGEVGAGVVIRASSDPWNTTGLTLEAGGTYHCTAVGEWRDWTILTDADGFESPGAPSRQQE